MEIDDLEFREFFAVQFGRLCWLGNLLTGDRGRVEELAQDALVRIYMRWRVRRPTDPAIYARRCASSSYPPSLCSTSARSSGETLSIWAVAVRVEGERYCRGRGGGTG